MPASAPKKSVGRVSVGTRRNGRPRAATAASKVYTDLRAELISLQRRPGDAVSEAQIALAHGISRTPVREAILKLADEGLLEIYPQSGIFVSRIPVAALPEAIIIRKALEETTARLAAQRATSSQVLALQSILERQREAGDARDREAFHQADEMFHAAVADIAGHPGIWKVIQQVKLQVDRYRRLTLPQRGRMAKVIVEHEAVLNAIESHDIEAARRAMGVHLDQLLANIAATRHINPEYFDEEK